MAITFPTFTYGGVTLSTSFAATKPTGTTTNTLLIAHCAATSAATFTPPAGWTAIGTATAQSALFYRICGGSEPATYTFSFGLTNADVYIQRVEGHDAVSPITAGTLKENTVVTTAPTSDSITAGAGDSLLTTCAVYNVGSGTVTIPSGMTQLINQANTSLMGGANLDGLSAGATGAKTWTTPSNTSATSAIAIKAGGFSGSSAVSEAITITTSGNMTASGSSAVSEAITITTAGNLTAAGSSAASLGVTFFTDGVVTVPAPQVRPLVKDPSSGNDRELRDTDTLIGVPTSTVPRVVTSSTFTVADNTQVPFYRNIKIGVGGNIAIAGTGNLYSVK